MSVPVFAVERRFALTYFFWGKILTRIICGRAGIELQPFRNEGKAAVP